jgi:hypothetical protein
VQTLGYYSAGDGGGNIYEIVAAATGTADGGSFIDLTGISGQAKGLFVDGVVNVKQFGAVGDGVNDDAAAIQAAMSYQASFSAVNDPEVKPRVLHFPSGTYLISTGVSVSTPLSITSTSASELLCAGTFGIEIGSMAANDLYAMDIYLPNIRRQTPQWDAGSFGFRGINFRNSRIYTRDIVGFEKGFDAAADSSRGFVYNDIFVGRLANNKYNLAFTETDTASTGVIGYVNENTWYGGKYEHRTGTPSTSGGAWGIYMPSRGGISNNGPNRNIFIRPTLENTDPNVVKIECGGDQNLFIAPRFEDAGATPGAVKFTATSRANVIDYCELFSTDAIFEDLGTGNVIRSFTNDLVGKSWSSNGAVVSASNIQGDDRSAVGAKALGSSTDVSVGMCGDGSVLWPLLSKRAYWLGDALSLSGGTKNGYAANYFNFSPLAASSVPNNSIFVDSADGAIKFKNSSGTVTAL